ncbi:MAG: DUF1929 domain-containing protein, partial [Microthrixaceae bacterium]|nr:DUF1929 domain-containing protein [Microthrixaceae bacterium]
GSGESGDGGGVCVLEPGIAGAWDTSPLDGTDPGEPDEDPLKDPPYDDICPHHPYLTAVHAAHLPTGEFLMYHGQNEERLWTIDAPTSDMRWVPLPYAIDAEHCNVGSQCGENCYPDIFCSGASLLDTGELFVVGGNVTGSPTGGGLFNTYLFDPKSADPDTYPFGWTQGPEMQVDRWYPTVTEFSTPTGPKFLISGGASLTTGGQNSFEVYDPAAGTNGTVTLLPVTFADVGGGDDMPAYPFIFQLPSGDLFYAGGEGAGVVARNGRALIPDFNNAGTWAWDDHVFASTTNGGSAVQYRPGKILKSGGLGAGEFSVRTTETIDLSDRPSGDYGTAGDFVPRDDMNFARHFNTLTMLCDGRVLVTGGNEKGNGELWHDISNPCTGPWGPEGTDVAIKEMVCDEAKDCPAVWSKCIDGSCPALGGSACETNDDCAMPCSSGSDCPLGASCEAGLCMGGAVGQAAAGVCQAGKCDPYHNSCYATHTAEIWDPDCDEWVQLGEEENPRMYHSTALLTPSCDVLSMGGGHRQQVDEEANAQYFRPAYGTGDAPQIAVLGISDDYGVVEIGYGGQPFVQVQNPDDVVPGSVNLLKLGSVTHQFNVSQMFIPLTAVWEDPWSGDMPFLTVVAPSNSNEAPPGYYMLVVLSDTGEPSNTAYVRLSGATSQIWGCPAKSLLDANETSCTAQPVGGVCPSGHAQTNAVALPTFDGVSGTTDGWEVLVPPGMVEHASAPTPDELAAIGARCVAACEGEWGDAAVSANCDAAGAFTTPQYLLDGGDAALDFVLPSQEQGQGVFAGQQLSCSLGSTCFPAFDENLSRVVPSRTTPAAAVVGDGEEYRVALGSTSKVEVISGTNSAKSTLSGSIGYAACTDGNASAPCPFYLGSLDAVAQNSITATLSCDDGSRQRQTLSNLVVQLGQPAFGIAQKATTSRGFPSGALVLTSSFDVGREHFSTRRPSAAKVVFSANGTTFAADNLDVKLRVPCNNSEASVTVRYTLRSPTTGSAIARPPTVSITTPAQVPCNGSATALAANATDPDGDLVGVRWRIDGVLMAPTTTTVVFTTGHVLAATAEDARGARTTVKKVVLCL